MVDFTAIKAQQALARLEAAKKAEEQVAETCDDLALVIDLLDNASLTPWEQGFCKSIKSWLIAKPGKLSPKQEAVLEKIRLKNKVANPLPSAPASKPLPTPRLPPIKPWEDADEDDVPF